MNLEIKVTSILWFVSSLIPESGRRACNLVISIQHLGTWDGRKCYRGLQRFIWPGITKDVKDVVSDLKD